MTENWTPIFLINIDTNQIKFHLKKYHQLTGWWAREVTQWLKALTSLPEDLDVIPRTHIVTQNCL